MPVHMGACVPGGHDTTLAAVTQAPYNWILFCFACLFFVLCIITFYHFCFAWMVYKLACHGAPVEARGQLLGRCSVLPSHGLHQTQVTRLGDLCPISECFLKTEFPAVQELTR